MNYDPIARRSRRSAITFAFSVLHVLICLVVLDARPVGARPTAIGNGVITDGGIELVHNGSIKAAYGHITTDGGLAGGSLTVGFGRSTFDGGINSFGPVPNQFGWGPVVTDGGIEIHGAPIRSWFTNSSGSPGNATIDKACGRSAIAAGASAATITNAYTTTTSIIDPHPESADATLGVIICVPGTGSFVCTNRAAGVATNVTANTTFNWCVKTVF